METIENQLRSFFKSLQSSHYHCQIKQSDMNTSLTKSNILSSAEIISIPSIISELFIIRIDTMQLLVKEHFNAHSSFTITSNCIPFHSFLKHKSETTSQSPISFDAFYTNTLLIQILTVSQPKLSLIGYFNANINTFFAKTLLLHLLTAFLNFQPKGEERLTQSHQAVFAKCFSLSLVCNFAEIFNFIMKKQELNLLNLKYKTFYLIDLSSNSVLFNLNAFHIKKTVLIESNEGLWKEILFHSHNLMMEYNAKHKKKFNAFYSSEYCVKLECRATYPRCIFVIKFVPVLHGVSLVHFYLQKKLSHVSDSSEVEKGYKEYDVMYGTEQRKSERGIEFKYVEPLKVKRIEQFFVNYFIATAGAASFYSANKYELKYFDAKLLKMIGTIIKRGEEEKVERGELIERIKDAFYMEAIEMGKKGDKDSRTVETSEELNVMNFIDFLYFSKDKFLKYYLRPEEPQLSAKANEPQCMDTPREHNALPSKLNNANVIDDITLTIYNKDDLVSDTQSNRDKAKSIFQLDITAIQRVSTVTDDNISNFYPKRTTEHEEPCISSARELVMVINAKEAYCDLTKPINSNWNVSNVPHDKELSFRHSNFI